MKGTIKNLTLVATMAVMMSACSTMTTVVEKQQDVVPNWYMKCKDTGTEGWFWWKEEYVFACGAGVSIFEQAAEEQMYAIAMNNFAKRINGRVNSETRISFKNNVRNTTTDISYKVTDTAVTQHLEEERGTYIYAGNHYTFVKLRMPKEVFDGLVSAQAVR